MQKCFFLSKTSVKSLSIPFVWLFTGILFSCNNNMENRLKTKGTDDPYPLIWTTFNSLAFEGGIISDSSRVILENELTDLKMHGVEAADFNPADTMQARIILEIARKLNFRIGIKVAGDPNFALIKNSETEPAYALMNGGAYLGKAIDRHVYSFSPEKHSIIVEPPVYNSGFAYIDKNTGLPASHYLLGTEKPVYAEIIIPLKEYDGKQHIKILKVQIREAPFGARPEDDSAAPEMMDNPEIQNRKLFQLDFDLSGYDKALLDKIGIAVYWESRGVQNTWFMMAKSNLAAYDDQTKSWLRSQVRSNLNKWKIANGGTFPNDVVFAGQYGDENFYLTGHLKKPEDHAVSIPLWDFSPSFIKEFYLHCSEAEYPRTWGFPEIYGPDSYAWWMYLLHKGAANLVNEVKDETIQNEAKILIYRNTTRNNIFSQTNDFDGSGQELLAQSFDILHLDPYPVMAYQYQDHIVRDMSYFAGLSRRYNKPLIPWVQACTDEGTLKKGGGMRHPTPEQMLKMIEEHKAQGIDGIKWFGYGAKGRWTYPNGNKDTWEEAKRVHQELKNNPPVKPVAKLAVIRPYSERALLIFSEGKIKNPADYYLQQFLEVWAMKYRMPYDVFEVPPGLSGSELDKIQEETANYPFVVSLVPWANAKLIGENSTGTFYDPTNNEKLQMEFEIKIREWGWLEKLGYTGTQF